MDPIEATDPMLPTESTEPSEQIERNEFRDRQENISSARLEVDRGDGGGHVTNFAHL